MPTLLVIQGPDQGRRFELSGKRISLGRDPSNAIRLHDSEVSRQHAELVLVDPEGPTHQVRDLGSVNGTFLNGREVKQSVLKPDDQIRMGRTMLMYLGRPGAVSRDLAGRVDMVARSSTEDRSEILRSIPASEGSRLLHEPTRTDGAVEGDDRLKTRLRHLGVIYEAGQAISHVTDPDALLNEILQLLFQTVAADRAVVLLMDDLGELAPRAVRWRDRAEPDERMAISRTIVEHVLDEGQGVITSDAPADKRFGPAESIVGYGIREAICVPIQGRYSNLGVLYADTRTQPGNPVSDQQNRARFTQDDLTLAVAIGHQAGLALENTQLHQAKLNAERLAAVGQTIATISHHTKNLLQGLKSGTYLIKMGLDTKDETITQRGWEILEKNQTKILNLVMDMLTYSKDRQPSLQSTDPNDLVAEAVALWEDQAHHRGITLSFQADPTVPKAGLDPDGIHRAVLNLITNALDAAEGRESARVDVSSQWVAANKLIRICIADNGIGIAPEQIGRIFEVFQSNKGNRGTGLGLPVTQKIVREHGGTIRVDSEPGRGSVFTIELPWRAHDSVPSLQALGPDDPLETRFD